MAEIIKTTFQLRRGYEAIWEKNNPILANGEPGFVIDKNKLKIGDGATAWKDLPYFGDGKSVEVEEIAEAVNKLSDNITKLESAINNSQEIEISEVGTEEEPKKALVIKEININKLVQDENNVLVLYGGSASKNI